MVKWVLQAANQWGVAADTAGLEWLEHLGPWDKSFTYWLRPRKLRD